VSAGKLDTGEAYQALRDAAARAAGFLIETSFSLLPEKSIVLDRNRAPSSTCAPSSTASSIEARLPDRDEQPHGRRDQRACELGEILYYPIMSESLDLLLDGERFEHWDDIELVNSIDRFSTLSFSAPFQPERAEFPLAFRPFSFQPVRSS
jgi:hypothetical protein